MIELLILNELTKKVLTMYGISKEIHASFSVLTTPSFGTIKPALTRLQKSGFVKSQKTMSKGGRPSVYYSITNEGREELTRLLLSNPSENPITFLTTARVRIACADFLNKNEQLQLFKLLKLKSETVMLDTKNLIDSRENDFYTKMVYDNIACEYKNFVSLLEGFERACKN